MSVVSFVLGRGETAVTPAVIVVLFHHSSMDTGPECNVVLYRVERK